MLGHLNILQINLNRSRAATESALQAAIENRVDLVLVQEPYLIKQGEDFSNCRSIHHQAFQQILEVPKKDIRPRTLGYLAKTSRWQVDSSSTTDSDLLILHLSRQGAPFTVVNAYNEKGQGEDRRTTLYRGILSLQTDQLLVLLGDFNLHYPW
jgi:hypothetical protein